MKTRRGKVAGLILSAASIIGVGAIVQVAGATSHASPSCPTLSGSQSASGLNVMVCGTNGGGYPTK